MTIQSSKKQFLNYLPLTSSWWYPSLKSIFENTLPPFSWSKKPSILWSGYLFLIVITFNCLESIQYLGVPSFFFTIKTGGSSRRNTRWNKTFLKKYLQSISQISLLLWRHSIRGDSMCGRSRNKLDWKFNLSFRGQSMKVF